MSAYTTLLISRGAALAKYLELTQKTELSNEHVEAVLGTQLRDQLYNFWIVPDSEATDDELLKGLVR